MAFSPINLVFVHTIACPLSSHHLEHFCLCSFTPITNKIVESRTRVLVPSYSNGLFVFFVIGLCCIRAISADATAHCRNLIRTNHNIFQSFKFPFANMLLLLLLSTDHVGFCRFFCCAHAIYCSCFSFSCILTSKLVLSIGIFWLFAHTHRRPKR